MRMTNGTELSLAIASCVDEQLSWCTLPLTVTGGDITTLLWDDGVTPGVIVAVVVVAVIAEVLSEKRAASETDDDDDVAWDAVTGDERTLERVDDEDLTPKTSVTDDTYAEVTSWNVADDAAVEMMTSEVEAVDIGGVPLVVPLRLRIGV